MAEREEPLPARIDRYEPLKKLATGGMAEIFLAKQSGLEGFEKVVVLKRILSHLASDEEFVSMFLDEARIAAKLSHPNIVQIYDLGKADNTYYIAMEYVSGRNVQHLINKQQQRGGHLPVEHVCRIIAGVCDGLFYAHSRKDYDGKALNIIHRDISPQNILVSFAGGVKVVDFGIAKASTQLAQTRAGVLKGKYAYMSPEQVRGAKIDARSDIFAVGLVMYEMLTNVRAFERESSLKTLKAIVQDKPLNPRELNPEIPMEVVKILSKSLEKNPDRRYKTAQEFQLALEDWLESSPKKSNNVRLSRFLYDLFDDELNSADGTMVVKGVGQVIIPTSLGKDIKPAVQEEVDSKTLTAALVDDRPEPPAPKAAAAPSPRVRDEVSARQAAAPKPTASTPKPATPAKQALKQPTPAPEIDDDNDGKTVPGYDLEQIERDRQAHLAAKAKAQMPSKAQVTTEANEEDEERTRAGVPMTSSPSMPEDSDSRARAMLEKVDSIAPPSARPAARAPGPRMESVPDAFPLPPPGAGRWDAQTKEPGKSAMSGEDLIVGSDGPIGRKPNPTVPMMSALPSSPAETPTLPSEPVGMPVGGMNAAQEAQPPPMPMPMPAQQETSATEAVRPARGSTPPQKKPAAFYAMVGASAGMTALAVLLFIVGAMAFPAPIPPVDYGVVVITSEPPGAQVVFDGNPMATPGQLVVPLDGVDRSVTVSSPGFKAREQPIRFPPGTNFVELNVSLEPG